MSTIRPANVRHVNVGKRATNTNHQLSCTGLLVARVSQTLKFTKNGWDWPCMVGINMSKTSNIWIVSDMIPMWIRIVYDSFPWPPAPTSHTGSRLKRRHPLKFRCSHSAAPTATAPCHWDQLRRNLPSSWAMLVALASAVVLLWYPKELLSIHGMYKCKTIYLKLDVNQSIFFVYTNNSSMNSMGWIETHFEGLHTAVGPWFRVVELIQALSEMSQMIGCPKFWSWLCRVVYTTCLDSAFEK